MTVESLALPVGMTWGEQSGDYRAILKDGKKFASFGGLQCKVTPPVMWQDVLDYEISRGEYEYQRRQDWMAK